MKMPPYFQALTSNWLDWGLQNKVGENVANINITDA